MTSTKGSKKKAVKKITAEVTREETIIKYGFITLAVIIGILAIYFASVNLIPKHYIKVGNRKVNEDEFMYQMNTQYNVFTNYYRNEIQSLGFDLTTQAGVASFLTTAYDNERSFGQFLLLNSVDAIQQNIIVLELIEEEKFQIDQDELEESYALQMESIKRGADEAGFDMDDYARAYFGTKLKAMQSVIRQTLRAQQYINHIEEQLLSAVTEDRARAYYDSTDGDGNRTKDSLDKVTVVNITKLTVDSSLNPLPEDAVAEAKLLAQEVYQKALDGEDIYELVKEYSDDYVEDESELEEEGAVAEKPGELTFAKADIGLTEISNWVFGAEEGDIQLVETEIGYVIVKLIHRTDFDEIKDVVMQTVANSDYQMKMNEYKSESRFAVGHYRPFQDLYTSYSIRR